MGRTSRPPPGLGGTVVELAFPRVTSQGVPARAVETVYPITPGAGLSLTGLSGAMDLPATHGLVRDPLRQASRTGGQGAARSGALFSSPSTSPCSRYRPTRPTAGGSGPLSVGAISGKISVNSRGSSSHDASTRSGGGRMGSSGWQSTA